MNVQKLEENRAAISPSDEELLGYFMPKKSAAYFLGEYGSLYEVVMNTSEAELQAARGIGSKRAEQFRFVRMLVQRLRLGEQKKQTFLCSPNEVFNVMSDLQHLKQEQFHVLLLNVKNGLLARKLITQGTVSYAPVAPREVFYPAIRFMAASVIFVHNHPSGDCQPSKEDITVTKNLVTAAKLMDIPILDHIIIGKGEYYSFADQGQLQDFEKQRNLTS